MSYIATSYIDTYMSRNRVYHDYNMLAENSEINFACVRMASVYLVYYIVTYKPLEYPSMHVVNAIIT